MRTPAHRFCSALKGRPSPQRTSPKTTLHTVEAICSSLPGSGRRLTVTFTKTESLVIGLVLRADDRLAVKFVPGAQLTVTGNCFKIEAAEGDGILRINGSDEVSVAERAPLGKRLQFRFDGLPAVIGTPTAGRRVLVVLDPLLTWHEIIPGHRWAMWNGKKVLFTSDRPSRFYVGEELVEMSEFAPALTD